MFNLLNQLMKIVSIWNNSLWYRLFILLIWLLVIFGLNYFLFAYFTGSYSNIWLVVLWLFLCIFLWYLIKYSKYKYIVEKEFLHIKTPSREYKVPLKDIKRIWEINNIPLIHKTWIKFDQINKILYLCPYSNKGIALDLWTHTIVICPRKYKEIKERL